MENGSLPRGKSGMNKMAIRNFAIWARNKLIADVSYHAGLLGITKNGISKALPQSTNDDRFHLCY